VAAAAAAARRRRCHRRCRRRRLPRRARSCSGTLSLSIRNEELSRARRRRRRRRPRTRACAEICARRRRSCRARHHCRRRSWESANDGRATSGLRRGARSLRSVVLRREADDGGPLSARARSLAFCSVVVVGCRRETERYARERQGATRCELEVASV
jgi:hypothetical protein